MRELQINEVMAVSGAGEYWDDSLDSNVREVMVVTGHRIFRPTLPMAGMYMRPSTPGQANIAAHLHGIYAALQALHENVTKPIHEEVATVANVSAEGATKGATAARVAGVKDARGLGLAAVGGAVTELVGHYWP